MCKFTKIAEGVVFLNSTAILDLLNECFTLVWSDFSDNQTKMYPMHCQLYLSHFRWKLFSFKFVIGFQMKNKYVHWYSFLGIHKKSFIHSIPKNRCSLTLWDQSDSSWVTLTTPEKVHIWRHLTAQEETSKWLRRRHQSDSGGDTKVTRGETPKWLGRSCLGDSS